MLRELEVDPNRDGAVLRPSEFDRANLHYDVVVGSTATLQRDLGELLTKVIPLNLGCEPSDLFTAAAERTLSGIVFVPHVDGDFGVLKIARVVSDQLEAPRESVGTYAGKMPSKWAGGPWDEEKSAVAARYTTNALPILVSTKAFGMGIDKPNIRWTLHVGIPSSIESFAQEAGRSGRDGGRSICVIAASHPSNPAVKELLGPGPAFEDRRARWRRIGGKDDISHQLFFLFGSFPGADSERQTASALLDELWAAGASPACVVAIPMVRAGTPKGRAWNDAKNAREKALYRLSCIGLVFDYTVGYGASILEVEMADFTLRSMDAVTLEYVQRVEPGRAMAHERAVAGAPLDLRERSAYLLGLIIDALYRVVVPARLHALHAMYKLTASGLDDTGIRGTINAYLDDGPVAGVLADAIANPSVDLDAIMRALDATPPVNEFEWANAAQRQIESFGRHPALLLVRSLGVAWLRGPDTEEEKEEFDGLVADLFAMLADYEISPGAGFRLAEWMMQQLRNQQDGRRWGWVESVWGAWDRTAYPDANLEPLEARVLARALVGTCDASELTAVLKRRVRRLAVVGDGYARRSVGSADQSGGVQ